MSFPSPSPRNEILTWDSYNAGHLIEAALAYTDMSGSDRFLHTMNKYVALMSATFGPGKNQKHAYCGHPEIELALLRLYSKTQDPSHYALARYFITERGNQRGQDGRHYYDVEADRRGWQVCQRPNWFPMSRSYWYMQAHQPIVDMRTVEGHAVRAMYLLTGTADMARIAKGEGDSKRYLEAVRRLWDNMVNKKMYLTGGIGSHDQWEGFGIDYFLPMSQDEGGCYAETCAAIGVMMLAERLLQLDLDGSVADIMELAFHNAVLTGMSSDGRRFTYVNRLASGGGWYSRREEWFDCACCPPNLTRLLGMLGGYMWTTEKKDDESEVAVNVHMYGSATLRIPTSKGDITVTQTSDWPWAGEISFKVHNPTKIPLTLRLRIPHYINNHVVKPTPSSNTTLKGYLTLPPSYTSSHKDFQLSLPLISRFISPHPYTRQPVLALARGPIVYCVEDVDNPWVQDHFKSLVIDPRRAKITETRLMDPNNNGEDYIALKMQGGAVLRRLEESKGPEAPTEKAVEVGWEVFGEEKEDIVFDDLVEELNFIPYYFRANRGGRGQMRVGLRRD